jgi:solute carrier family 24 (sodium/potassium/calcium exchanger), member 6
MKMPPDIAGVTLLAFASGAPDLFTQIAALAEGSSVAIDLDLAVSATFGSGLFIICVVFSVVILMGSNEEGSVQMIPDHRVFIRDCMAYLLASVATLILVLWGERFTAWDGGFLLLCESPFFQHPWQLEINTVCVHPN